MLILGSASPRRRELLAKMGYDFRVETAEVTELEIADELCTLPILNSQLKAEAIGKKFPEDVVIGADTIILFQNRAIGKPKDLMEAKEILRLLSGNCHQVITGVAIRCVSKCYIDDFSVTTEIKFRNFSDDVIEDYLKKVYVLDKAGAYAIQEFGDMLTEKIVGDFNNVIGLPCQELEQHLKPLTLIL